MSDKQKLPEIERFYELMAALGKSVDDIALETGIPLRTITNFLYNNKAFSGKLLRELLFTYNVSVDWMLSGLGSMFIGDMPPEAKKYLIRHATNLDNDHLSDHYLLIAAAIERSLQESGARPHMDYSLLDLYRLAQPHVVAHDAINPLKVFI